jgi:hypothetical protein
MSATLIPAPLLIALECVLGLGVAALNLWFWFRLIRAEPRFRAWVERRYGVVITLGARGHWNVSGSGSRLVDFALEWLQLAYFMAGFTVWALGLLVMLGMFALLQRISL